MGQGVGWGQSRQAWEDMQLEAIISTGEKVVEQLEKLRGGVLKKAPQEYGDRRARSVWSWPERDKLANQCFLAFPGGVIYCVFVRRSFCVVTVHFAFRALALYIFFQTHDGTL